MTAPHRAARDLHAKRRMSSRDRSERLGVAKVVPFRNHALLSQGIVLFIAVALCLLAFAAWKACAVERRPSDGAAPFLGPTGDAHTSTSQRSRS